MWQEKWCSQHSAKMESLFDLVLEKRGYHHPITVDSESRHSNQTSQAHARVSLRKRTMEDEMPFTSQMPYTQSRSVLCFCAKCWPWSTNLSFSHSQSWSALENVEQMQAGSWWPSAQTALNSGQATAVRREPWHGPALEERVACPRLLSQSKLPLSGNVKTKVLDYGNGKGAISHCRTFSSGHRFPHRCARAFQQEMITDEPGCSVSSSCPQQRDAELSAQARGPSGSAWEGLFREWVSELTLLQGEENKLRVFRIKPSVKNGDKVITFKI